MTPTHHRIFIALALCICLIAGRAAAAETAPHGFRYRTFVDADKKSYPYVIFIPHKLDPGSRPPVILFLHGSGERGDNGLDQIMVGLGTGLWKQRATFPFVAVFPQCATDGRWFADGADAKRALMILKQAQDEFHTDPDRVYLTGLSMGGTGTWSLAAAHPGMFAAIVPMCAPPDPELAQKFAAARLPIWNFCGDKDQVETVTFCRLMHKALTKAGAHDRYTEYPGVGHNCWDDAYGTPELFTWLLDQARSQNH
jgi:predicted peptidase